MRLLPLVAPLLLAAAALASEKPVFSREVAKPVDVMDRFPLAVGNRWVYDWTYRENNDDAKGIVKATWTSEIEVVAHRDVRGGREIERRQTIRDLRYDFPEEAPAESRERIRRDRLPGMSIDPLLIRGNYVYEGAGPDDEDALPVFFFPMSVGVRWAERDREDADLEEIRLERHEGDPPLPTMYYWVVEGREAIRVPYGTVDDAWRLAYRGLPDHVQLWFKDGIGPVKEAYSHHGTLVEWEAVLKEFHAAGRRSAADPNGPEQILAD